MLFRSDVYWSNELTHAAGKQQGLYEKLDPKIVTNLPDIIDIARDPDGIGSGIYMIATGLHYNSQAFREAGIPKPSSWEDLWNPRLKGKVALYSFDVAYSQDLLVLLTHIALPSTSQNYSALAQSTSRSVPPDSLASGYQWTKSLRARTCASMH